MRADSWSVPLLAPCTSAKPNSPFRHAHVAAAALQVAAAVEGRGGMLQVGHA
jgi:hypothetical protein